MSLKDVMLAYFDLLMPFYVFILIIFGLGAWGLSSFYRSAVGTTFKVLVSILIAAGCLFLVIFSLAMYYILADTSFINHIYEGDLIPHLEKGLGL